MTDMQPGWIQVISEPRNFNPDNAIEQIMADDPPVWFKFDSSTSMTNSGVAGSSFDGTYSSPPVTLTTGPITVDSVTNKGLRMPVPTVTTTVGTVPTGASFINRGGYSALTLYAAGDLVYSSTSLNPEIYQAQATSTGQALSNTTYWLPYLPSSTSVPLSLPSREAWSVELWIKYDAALTGDSHLYDVIRGEDSVGNKIWSFSTLNGAYTFGSSNTVGAAPYGTWSAKFSTSVTPRLYDDYDPTEWRHIVITNSGSSSWASSGRKAFYIDGELVGERINGVETSGLRCSGTPYGTYSINQSDGNSYTHSPGATDVKLIADKNYQGNTPTSLAHVAFYDRELSTDRVRQHFMAAP